MPRTVRLLVYGLFLASGATALVYQVAWTRNLSLIFGASFEAISVVLAAFMGGLALGGVCFGRLCNRVRHPLRLYGCLELGVAAFALVLPWLLHLVGKAYVGVALRVDGVNWTITLMRTVLALAVLVLPTFFMGGTLPVLTRFLVSRYAELGERLSGLYAINTFGAVLGTLAGGFILLPQLGVWRAQLVAVAGNLVIGVVAIVADHKIRVAGIPGETGDSPVSSRAGDSPAHPWGLRLAFWGTAVAGMSALALEVMWSRAISIATGTTTYSFTIMLASFLVGISLGSWLHALWPLRRVHESVQFGVVLVSIGLASLCVSQLIPRLPEYAVRLNLHFYGGLKGVRSATTLVLSFLIMLVPCVFMGVAFPLAGQARAKLKQRFSESVGDLVALNTGGAIVGSLLAGFVVIPLLGLQRGMVMASGAYLCYGLSVLWVMYGSHRRHLRGLAAGGAVASIAIAGAACVLVKPWDTRLLATFENNKTRLFVDSQGRLDMAGRLERTRLLYYRQGRGSSVSVIDDAGYRSLTINGKCVASDGIQDMQHEYLLGHLPTLLHPAPRSAVVIGLGAGLTLGGVAADESIERVVVVEIEPAVVPAAAWFADLHDDALNDPRLEVVYQDGRNYLQTTCEKFDIITADPIHPWAQGAAYLYTTEYFGLISQHLSNDGVGCQWLPLYELSVENLRSVVASFAANFKYTTLWQTVSDCLLIGSNVPIKVDLADLSRRLQQPRVARQLSRVGLNDPLSFLAEFTMDQSAIQRFANGAIINSDDNLYLEFSSPLNTGTGTGVGGSNSLLIDAYRISPASVLDPGALRRGGLEPRIRAGLSLAREESQELPVVLGLYQAAKSQMIRASIEGSLVAAAPSEEGWMALTEQVRRVLDVVPDYGPARHLLSISLRSLGSLRLEEGDSTGAFELFREAAATDAGNADANLHLGTILSNQGRLARALPYYRRALNRRPYFPQANASYGVTLAALGRFDEAMIPLQKAVRQRPDNADVHHTLAFCLGRLGRAEEATAHRQTARRVAPDRAVVFQVLGDGLSSQQRYHHAVAALREGLASNPGHHGLSLRLAWLLATSPDPVLRDGIEAVRLGRRVAKESDHPQVLDVLAAALAEAGQYDEAVEVARRAAEAALSQGHAGLADQVHERLTAYEAGRPYRQRMHNEE